ncbi:MAG: YihY/virulence factor BrkB family protein [Ilumatobacter sp.]|uniref:YihY/virulence factor BrkB family protein n=1 Tax=Ilumatobacter sp. TaxID=1967498 RepID=UPI003C71F44D
MWNTLRELIREIRKDDLFDVAAGVSFWLLLSLPAALLAGLSSVSLLGDGPTEALRNATIEFIERVLVDQAETLSRSVDSLFDDNRPGVLSASIATAIFTLSRGFAGLIRGLDSVYDIEDGRNFAHTRLLAIGLAIGTLLTVALSTALWSAGRDAGIPVWLRLLPAFGVLILWSATMFHIGPHHHTPWRYDLPGAALAAFGWLALSLGFGWYVRILGGGDSNDLIGAAGALLLGLTWLWAAVVVFLIGGELNQILADRAGVIGANRTIVGRLRARRDDRLDVVQDDHSDDEAEPDGQ